MNAPARRAPDTGKVVRGGAHKPRAGLWVTDLRDFVGPDGDLAGHRTTPGHFVAAMVEAATARSPGPWAATVVRCTLRRPARSKCEGLARVRSDGGDEIEWQCAACRNQGAIRGWQESPFDLRRARDARRRGPRTTVVLSLAEYEAIKDSLSIGVDHAEVLAAAIPTDEGPAIDATAEEIDSLSDGVAAEANHASSRRIQLVLDGAFERLRAALDLVRPPGPSDSVRAVNRPITAEAVADGIAATLGASPDVRSRHRGIFVEIDRVGLEAHALKQRIRRTAKESNGKAPLLAALELAGHLDQAATFGRCHPGGGVRVLVAFIEALRGLVLSEDFAPLIFDTATALLASAKAAPDPRALHVALGALVTAHVDDPRFGAVAAAIEGARLGKRATKSALKELDRIGSDARDDARRRASNLRRTLSGSHLS